jgi:UDPglucose 6-dehydrogenase
MNQLPVSVVDAEDGAFLENTASTAPTTPEGSLSFSPVLRAAADGPLDIESTSLPGQASNHRSLSSALLDSGTRPVRNICCVGAGYVGE